MEVSDSTQEKTTLLRLTLHGKRQQKVHTWRKLKPTDQGGLGWFSLWAPHKLQARRSPTADIRWMVQMTAQSGRCLRYPAAFKGAGGGGGTAALQSSAWAESWRNPQMLPGG